MIYKKVKLAERVVEAYLVKRVKQAGGIAYKFTSPQRRSVPDRLVLLDIAKAGAELKRLLHRLGVPLGVIPPQVVLETEAAEIVAAAVHFVETKATGQEPTPMQEREHAKLRAMGFTVKVIDDKDTIDRDYPT